MIVKGEEYWTDCGKEYDVHLDDYGEPRPAVLHEVENDRPRSALHDAAMEEGFWGRAAARLMKRVNQLETQMYDLRKELNR